MALSAWDNQIAGRNNMLYTYKQTTMNKTLFRKALLLIGLISIPAITFAATGAAEINAGFTSIGGVVTTFTQTIVRSLATLFATMAMVAFFYGIVQYIWGVRDGKPDKVSQGNTFMIWGMVALFVMFSVWGIVTYAQRIFGIEGKNTIVIPTINLGDGGDRGGSGTSKASTGLPVTQTQDNANWAASNASCTGKPTGTACTMSGKAGTCGYNDEGSSFGCYVTAGGSTGTGAAAESPCKSITNPDRALECYQREKTTCGSNQAMGPNGCYDVNGQ